MSGRARSVAVEALVWRRSDFRESSRVVTLLTREHGKVRALAKGAHRPDSVLLGKIDYLNLLRVDLWRRDSTMPLLSRAELLHEPRGLRAPSRFAVADYLVDAIDLALPDERPDSALADLVHGALLLLERCPENALAVVLCGLEWRLLLALGAQPPVDACASTGTALAPEASVALAPDARGFVPAGAASAGASTFGPGVRDLLRELGAAPARTWASLRPAPAVLSGALQVLGRFLVGALEEAPRSRAAAVRVALRAMAT